MKIVNVKNVPLVKPVKVADESFWLRGLLFELQPKM
jgi:hypothetical protein